MNSQLKHNRSILRLLSDGRAERRNKATRAMRWSLLNLFRQFMKWTMTDAARQKSIWYQDNWNRRQCYRTFSATKSAYILLIIYNEISKRTIYFINSQMHKTNWILHRSFVQYIWMRNVDDFIPTRTIRYLRIPIVICVRTLDDW